MLSAVSLTHNTYPQKGWIFPRAMGSERSEIPCPLYGLSLTCSSPWCCVVGVQLLQVGGTAVCFDCLCTSGIPASQLTLQDENGIYALINSPYFFVRGRRGGSHPPRCQLHVTAQSTPEWLMFSKFSLALEMETIRKILGWCEDFPNTCLPPLMHICLVLAKHVAFFFFFFCRLVHFHFQAHVYFIRVCVHTSW